MSTHPGVTIWPSASISSLPFSSTEPTFVILSLSIAMSPTKGFPPLPSTTNPFLITKSHELPFLLI